MSESDKLKLIGPAPKTDKEVREKADAVITAQLKEWESQAEQIETLQARIEELEAAWKDSIDGVERIAFNIEPPNEHTPRLIMWVNQMRNERTRITTGG